MSTTIRSKISEKNKYWISQHRYYELKHFCLQYREWKEEYQKLSDISAKTVDTTKDVVMGDISDPVTALAVRLAKISGNIDVVDRSAKLADAEIAELLVLAVSQNCPYEYLYQRKGLLYSRQKYYEIYRKFFWILDKER